MRLHHANICKKTLPYIMRMLSRHHDMFDQVMGRMATGDNTEKDDTTHDAVISLVVRSQEGEEEAFEELYNMFVQDLYRYTASRIPDDQASDLVSEMFFRIWKKLPDFEGHAHAQFRAWMFTIAHHRIIDFYRTNKETLPLEETIEIEDENTLTDPRHQLATEVDFDRTQDALRKLPQKQQEALILRYINDISLTDIADIMQEKEGNVRILLHRGLKRLRELLETE